MIDLHTHTNYSDGTWDTKRLLEEAEKTKLEVLAITDHDTLDAHFELEKDENLRNTFTGKIKTGIEFNTVYDGIHFHMLAYDFDIHKLQSFVHNYYNLRKPNLRLEFEEMMKSIKKSNLKIDEIIYDEKKGWPIDIIYPEVIKYEENRKYFKDEEWNDIDVFFNSCVTNKNFPVAVNFEIHYPNAKLVAEEVRKAGGKTFLAHVYRYNLEDEISFLDILKNDKIIDGVEVYHSSFTEKQSEKLLEYCNENNLLVSGGTDCHRRKEKRQKNRNRIWQYVYR